jgi:hypothetical protein
MKYAVAFFLATVMMAPPGCASDRVVSVKEIIKRKAAGGYAALRAPNAEGCETGQLPAEGGVDANLASTDCVVRDIVPVASVPAAARGNFADVYRITVPRKSVLRVEMTSTQVDSYLYLLRGPSGAVLASNDNGPSGNNAVFSIHLDAGSYLLVATSAAPVTGDYKLSSKLDNLRQCTEGSLRFDSEAEGSLGDPDCRFLDLRLNSSDAAYLDQHKLEVTRRGVVVVTMNSAELDSYLIVADSRGAVISRNDNSGPENNARLSISLEPGAYVIIATTAETGTGSYKLLARLEDQRPCSTAQLNPAAAVPAALAADDCRGLDFFVPSSDENYADSYEFELTAAKLVTVTARSAEFDTILTLLDSTGESVVDNDDFEETTTDSQLLVSLPPGKYRVLASSYEPATGAYQINLLIEDLRRCTVETQATPGNRNGALTGDDCRFLDFMIPGVDRIPVDVYSVKLDKRSVLTLEVKSAAFDTGIFVVDSKMRVVNGDDDGGGGTNSKLDLMLNPGEYAVVVTALDDRSGMYDLATSIRDPQTCAAEEIGTDSSKVGALSSSDCRLKDLVIGFTEESPADQYTFTLTERRKVTVEAGSGDFVAAVLPLDNDYNAIEQVQQDITEERGVATFTAGPGSYRLALTTLTETGSYVVKLSTQAP